MAKQYDVFLSHNSRDKAAVEELAKWLSQEVGLSVFLDAWELVPGDNWLPALEAAVESSKAVAVFFGPAGVGAWHEEEKQLALSLVHRANRGKRRVFAVLMPGADRTQVSGFLSLRTWADLSGDDGARNLVAGIRGVAPIEVTVPPSGAELVARLKDAHQHGKAADGPSGPLDDFPTYRKRMRTQHQHMRLVGFDESVKVAIELSDLYVDLDVVLDHGPKGRVVFSDAHHAQAHAEQYLRCDRISMAKAFGLADTYGKRGLVVLGDPGSGKTTQLRRVLLQALEDPEELGLPKDVLPVFLPLRELSGDESAQTLVQFIGRVLSGKSGVPREALAQRLVERGKLLLLLDGLDEVADQAERDRVARWIEDLLGDVPSCRFVVSSRYAGYAPKIKLDDAFLELHLRPLTDAQAQAFVNNWYRVVEQAEAEVEGVEAKPGRPLELLEQLHELERRGEAQLFSMTRNPLLLTALCLVHRRREGVLPQDREALYRECTGVLLEGWRRRRLPMVLPAEQARRVLQPVALWMHEKEKRIEASAAELAEPVRRGLSSMEPPPKVEPEAFLRRIRDESGLLTGWGLDRYGFMHLGFQEYLAALELRGRGDDELSRLAERFGQTWWQEVILLMLAKGEVGLAERFLKQVAARPELPQWTNTGVMSRALGLAGEGVLARLDEVMLGHASPQVQTWWRRLRGLETKPGRSKPAARGGVELVLVPAGSFMMGSPDDEEGRINTEGPQHEVELAAFYLARTPVTNAQYGEYMKATGASPPANWGESEYNQPNQPVVGVSWKDAQRYCEWAGLSLPTEAQWEYACRAGTTTRYCSGDSEDDLRRVGWYRKNSDERLHPVGELEPNAWGLYDMHGNVYEWCQDLYGSYPGTKPRAGDELGVEPVGVAYRMIRGGYFDHGARYARSAYRLFLAPSIRNMRVGFRPAQGIP